MAVTIKDIAREANVSAATVSKVLNDKMYVAPATRDRVLEVMKKYNYAPNASASNLARKSSRAILYADRFYKGLAFENPHEFEILCGVAHELRRKQYQLILLDLSADASKSDEILEEAILSKKADGLIFNAAYASPSVEKLLLQYDYPQMCIGKPTINTLLSWIDTNHSLSASIAVDHLVSRGKRRLAFMGGQKTEVIFMDRLAGFMEAALKHDLQIPPEYIIYNEPNVTSIQESAANLLMLPEPPDGIICTNSLMAVGTVNAANTLGISIPRELSIVAFDDYPYSSIILPEPTVIDIDLFSLGIQAGNSLLRKIRNPSLLIQTYTALPNLIQRQTT